MEYPKVGPSKQLLDFREAASNPPRKGSPPGEMAAREMMANSPEEFHKVWAKLEEEYQGRLREERDIQLAKEKQTTMSTTIEKEVTEKDDMMEGLLSQEWQRVKV